MRINKFLAESGVASRRNADKLIADGVVTVNDKTAALGMEIDPASDTVKVDGQKVNVAKKFEYYMMN